MADFDPSVDLLAATDPKYLILDQIGSILDEKLTNGQLELQLGDRVVGILERCGGTCPTTQSSRVSLL